MATLPRRSSAGGSRSRGITLPGIDNVGRAPTARDPGVSVPAGAFTGLGTALSEAGSSLSKAADNIRVGAERMQKRFDADQTGRAFVNFQRETMTEFRRRQTEDDATLPDFSKRFDEFTATHSQTVIESLPKGISGPALERLKLRMESSRNAMFDNANVFQLGESKKSAKTTVGELTNMFAEQAAQQPDAAGIVLLEYDDNLRDFTGLISKEDRIKGRKMIVGSQIDGFLKAGRVADAKAVLADDAHKDLFTRENRAALKRRIDAGTKIAVQSATVEFMQSSTSFTQAATDILSGNTEGSNLGNILKSLPKDERTIQTRESINTARAHFSLDNDIRQAEDDAAARQSRELKAAFYETEDDAERARLLGAIKLNGSETPENIEKMEAIASKRVAFGGTNDEETEVQTRQDILHGRIGLDELEKRRGSLDKEAFTKAVALWRSVQNAAVANSMRFIDRELGIPSGVINFSDELLRRAQKADGVKNELQTWLDQDENKGASDAQIRAKRDELLKGAREGVDKSMADDAVSMLNRRAAAIPGLDPTNPEVDLERLIKDGTLAADDSRVLSLLRAIKRVKDAGRLPPRREPLPPLPPTADPRAVIDLRGKPK